MSLTEPCTFIDYPISLWEDEEEEMIA